MKKNITDFFNDIKGKKIAFCGLGVSNLPLVKLFTEKDMDILACDKVDENNVSNEILNLKNLGVKLKLGKDYLKDLNVDIIFRSPGINFLHPELQKARQNGTAVTSEMEVFFDLCPCKIIAVTGSDGKTTTSTIISKILEHSGKRVHLGGNIGTPLLPTIEKINKNDIAVVELSSFQLMSMRSSPDIAVVTNIGPNHLDVHKDMNEYVSAKKNIFVHQNAFSKTILNFDNKITRDFYSECRGKTIFFSTSKELNSGTFLKNGVIYFKSGDKCTPVINTQDIKIPGVHNVENYLAAICATIDEVNIDDIVSVAKNFNGVEHRIEFVRDFNGVKYYNDSIASTPTRVIKGTLSLFDKKIILIAGGYDKKVPFDAFGDAVVNKVSHLILLGQTADEIEKAVKNSSKYTEGNPEIVRLDNMTQAVNLAREIAKNGDIVALSPACASFGLYKNFDERGKHFKSLVNSLE